MSSVSDTRSTGITTTLLRREDLAAVGEGMPDVDNYVRGRLAECKFAYYLNDVTWRFDGGTLILDGHVPTFALKHALESLFRDIEKIVPVVNDVEVVSSTGLSSVRSPCHCSPSSSSNIRER